MKNTKFKLKSHVIITKFRIKSHSNYQCMYVCMFNRCPCVHGKGQHQLGQEVLFSRPSKQTWLATHRWLSGSQPCSRALRLVWKTNPVTFTIGLSRNRTGHSHFTSRQNHHFLSQKDSLQAVGLLFWLGARRHWCRRRKYYICPAPLHQPPN